ncbi:hypothetical protein [Sphingomonas sp.]|uniref:hypothetical protein n=1 Tax=Sphingomonas sp. TaxID=28214 RepID=UPI002D803828|nr:hypothetical protein [Sphingomonas sp.]HEU0044957.1 hypothetical protein [Sphingomonas sp.]
MRDFDTRLPEPAGYYRTRAEAELKMARAALVPAAADAHYELANLYLARLEQGASAGAVEQPRLLARTA